MTPPNAMNAPLLLTDDDVLARVGHLVGPAITDGQLWVMFVDGDSRQAPLVMPISAIPRRPDPEHLGSLAEVLRGLRPELTTDLGPGSVILTLERVGVDAVLPDDRAWADALTTTCERAGVGLRGVFLSTGSGVRRLTSTSATRPGT